HRGAARCGSQTGSESGEKYDPAFLFDGTPGSAQRTARRRILSEERSVATISRHEQQDRPDGGYADHSESDLRAFRNHSKLGPGGPRKSTRPLLENLRRLQIDLSAVDGNS